MISADSNGALNRPTCWLNCNDVIDGARLSVLKLDETKRTERSYCQASSAERLGRRSGVGAPGSTGSTVQYLQQRFHRSTRGGRAAVECSSQAGAGPPPVRCKRNGGEEAVERRRRRRSWRRRRWTELSAQQLKWNLNVDNEPRNERMHVYRKRAKSSHRGAFNRMLMMQDTEPRALLRQHSIQDGYVHINIVDVGMKCHTSSDEENNFFPRTKRFSSSSKHLSMFVVVGSDGGVQSETQWAMDQTWASDCNTHTQARSPPATSLDIWWSIYLKAYYQFITKFRYARTDLSVASPPHCLCLLPG